ALAIPADFQQNLRRSKCIRAEAEFTSRRIVMKALVIALLALSLLAPPTLADAPETVIVGGLVVTVPANWTQKRTELGLVLKPNEFALRDDCAFTLLGGEAFDGSLKDRLAEEWAGFEKLGTLRDDD